MYDETDPHSIFMSYLIAIDYKLIEDESTGTPKNVKTTPIILFFTEILFFQFLAEQPKANETVFIQPESLNLYLLAFLNFL
jgi:hypothetical protein